MKKVNLKKVGISMVALVITIIVLIILAAALVITGVNAPKQARLATFYSNIDTVQELVSLTIGNNMITAAVEGHGANYKWVGIVAGYYLDNNGNLVEPTNGFLGTAEGIGENIEPIMSELLNNTTMAVGEKEKYYVGESGKVYYEGFEYEGKTYYNKDTSKDGINNKIEVEEEIPGIKAADIKAEPGAYYGAYVNYTQLNGEPFKSEEYIDYITVYPEADIEWRIFYADEEHIYITTSDIVEYREYKYDYVLNSVEDLREDKATYRNDMYAEWATDGIRYEMFIASMYDTVDGLPPDLEGNLTSNMYNHGYTDVPELNETLQEGLYIKENMNYWLASSDYEDGYYVEYCSVLMVARYAYGNKVYRGLGEIFGIRPLVCLKSTTRLVENNGRYDIVGNGKPTITNETSTTLDTITIKAVDDNGIIGYAVTENNVKPTNFTSCTSTKTLTQVVDGKKANTTYYVWVKDNEGKVSEGKPVKTFKKVTVADIEGAPELYYGAYVNYTNGEGQPFQDEDGENIEWRIFHTEGGNIYLTTNKPVGKIWWTDDVERQVAIDNLKADTPTYLNSTYAVSAKNGIKYEMFKNSYKAIAEARGISVVGNDVYNKWLEGDEETGYYGFQIISHLSGLQLNLYSDDYNYNYDWYWGYYLASLSAEDEYSIMCVEDEYVNYFNYDDDDLGIRPLVCLKSNVQLEWDGDAYNIVLQE